MKIQKEYRARFNERTDEALYVVTFKIINNDGLNAMYVFSNSIDKIKKEGTAFVDINKFNNEDFLKENNIEYLIEEDDKFKQINLIPVGLVDFIDDLNFNKTSLNLCNFDGVSLEKANQVINNIEKAIKIKHEAYKFKIKFSNNGSTENVELD